MVKTRTKIFISNKGALLETKLNDELDRLEQEGYFIRAINTDISFSGATGYQTMATIIYEEYIEDDLDIDYGIKHFDLGECMVDCENFEA